jgi:hypothetical protein
VLGITFTELWAATGELAGPGQYLQMMKRLLLILVPCLLLVPGCSEVNKKKRKPVAEQYAKFVGGEVVSCQHPQWNNESSECLIEIGYDCKRIITVDDVSSELKEEICTKD